MDAQDTNPHLTLKSSEFLPGPVALQGHADVPRNAEASLPQGEQPSSQTNMDLADRRVRRRDQDSDDSDDIRGATAKREDETELYDILGAERYIDTAAERDDRAGEARYIGTRSGVRLMSYTPVPSEEDDDF